MAQQTTTTTVVTNQPTKAVFLKQERDWSTGLMGCFEDMGSCLCAFFCPGCLACQVSSEAREFLCVPMCVPGGLIALRTKIRTENDIRGSICDDYIKVAFCPVFTLAQMKREQMNIKAGRV